MLWKCSGVVTVAADVVVMACFSSLRKVSFILLYCPVESVGCLFCWCLGGGLWMMA